MIVFLSVYGLQRAPVLTLMFLIIFGKGPELVSKVILFIAVLLNLVNDFPITLWATVINKDMGCSISGVFSWLDIVNVSYIIGLILFFAFLRKEFMRNKEDAIWTIIKHKQDPDMNFKDFKK